MKLEKIKEGEDKGKCRVKILGFDYYNPVNGAVESGSSDKVAMWMLDTDYDGYSLFPARSSSPGRIQGLGQTSQDTQMISMRTG